MRFPLLSFGIPIALLTSLTPLSFNSSAPLRMPQVLAQTSEARKAEADRLLQQGIQQVQTSQFEAALQSWQQALTIYRDIKDRSGEGKALGNLGIAYYRLGDYAKSIDYQQQRLAVAKEIQDREGEGNALGNLGLVYSSLGDYAKAIEYHQQSLAIAKSIQNRESEGASLANLGLAYYRLGDYAKAIEYQQQSLAIAREIKDRLGEGNALGNLGIAYDALGDYPKAIEYQQQHLAIAKSIRDRLGEAESLSNLGNAYQSLGDYAKGIEYYQQSLAIRREIKDREGEGASLVNLGNGYYSLGDYAKAIDYYQQALAIAKSLQYPLGEEQSLGNLGNVYNALGDYAKAIDYYQQALAIAQSIKDRLGESNALGNLGHTYYLLGDYAKAIAYQQQSLAIKREIQDRLGESNALGNLGIAYYSLGEYAKAIEYQQQRLAISREIQDRSGEGQSLGDLGNAYDSLGDHAKAIEYHQQCLAIAKSLKDRSLEGKALGNLGLAYNSLGNYAKAIEYHQQSLAIAKSIGDENGEGQSLNNIGLALQESGNLTEAEKNLRAGIEVWESQRARLGENDDYKVSIFEAQATTYRLLQQVLIAQNQPNAALEIAERGRARAFVELLRRRNATTIDSANSPVTPPTIEQLRQIAKKQEATLVEYSIIYNDFKVKGKEGFHESDLYIWVIKPTGEVTFRKVDLKPLWQQQNTTLADFITISRDSIGVRGRGLDVVTRVEGASPTNRLQQLHQLLIQPIADLLPSDPTARVIFIPQQELFLVPFPALQDASGQYLIQKHTILTAPAIAVLDLTHQRRQHVPGSAQDVLVVGNPTMPLIQPPGQKPTQLKPLAGAEQEAKTIATLFNTQAFTENQATKALIVSRLPNAKIIHLATHGLLDDFSGEGVPGAIALAPSKPGVPNDGLLTSNEILDLKLNAELVVLSACDTGGGRLTGDGVIGLSRSLITAGVPSIIVSLWSIPDAPTAQLMSEFYQNLQKNPDKAIALRQAMLKTMEKYPQPQNWAAFTLIGESN